MISGGTTRVGTGEDRGERLLTLRETAIPPRGLATRRALAALHEPLVPGDEARERGLRCRWETRDATSASAGFDAGRDAECRRGQESA